MNRGHIQAERAASAQRDLFDTQIRIEDQLIEQKSEMHHPGSNAATKTIRHYFPTEKRANAFYLTLCDQFHSVKMRGPLCREQGMYYFTVAEKEPAGPTVRNLTDTFNNKL